MPDIPDKVVDILMDLKSDLGNLYSDMKNVKDDINEMKLVVKELIKIEKGQQRLEDEITKLMSAYEDIIQLRMCVNELKRDVEMLKNKDKEQSDRVWNIIMSVVEKLLWWGILVIIAYKEKLL